MKFQCVDQSTVISLFAQLELILDKLEQLHEGWHETLITDKHTIEELNLKDSELAFLSKELSLEINKSDLFIDVAKRLKEKEKSNNDKEDKTKGQ